MRLEHRPGIACGFQHTAFKTDFLAQVFRASSDSSPADAKVLLRQDGGFDGAHLLFLQARKRWTAMGRSFDFITVEPAQAE